MSARRVKRLCPLTAGCRSRQTDKQNCRNDDGQPRAKTDDYRTPRGREIQRLTSVVAWTGAEVEFPLSQSRSVRRGVNRPGFPGDSIT